VGVFCNPFLRILGLLLIGVGKRAQIPHISSSQLLAGKKSGGCSPLFPMVQHIMCIYSANPCSLQCVALGVDWPANLFGDQTNPPAQSVKPKRKGLKIYDEVHDAPLLHKERTRGIGGLEALHQVPHNGRYSFMYWHYLGGGGRVCLGGS
jgi:hypothetical protein